MLGAWLTVQLSVLSMLAGLVLAVLVAVGKLSGPKPVKWVVSTYIEVIRNTPFLVQIFLVFFGLPALGLRLSPTHAALLAMTVNIGAYAGEIIRAGIQSIDRGQIEAGRALGLSPSQIFRNVVFRPGMRAIYPALSSQYILLMLQSSVVSAISAEELTSIAYNIQSQTFTSFEVYLVTTGMYLGLTLLFSSAFALIGRLAFSYPTAR
jgi:polar amino acid transport system permease protein